MHVCWLKNRTWTCTLPPGITPYEWVYGEPPTIANVPIWGCLVWVLDTSDGKLTARVQEGRWVSFSLESNGHRIYWPEKRAVTVKHNIVFSREHLPVVLDEDVFETVITDEVRGSDNAIVDPVVDTGETRNENGDE